MNEYLVTWKIDLYADSPEQAAVMALAIQRDPESSATHFEVDDGTTVEITHVDIENEL